jgi:hypothetical protein
MEEKDVESWEAIEQEVKSIQGKQEFAGFASGPLLFRGQANSLWQLTTTLERVPVKGMPFMNYYRVIAEIRPEIESFTGRKWRIPTDDEALTWLQQDQLDTGIFPQSDAYSYMVYLRHHGFPSPLLDWTRSLYVAAYFAFREPSRAKTTSIYALWESPAGGKEDWKALARLHRLGQHVTAHRRHFLQQCDYTICLVTESQPAFAEHEQVFARGADDQDLLWKFNIPSTERKKVLGLLDQHNLNAFSLFGTEESLMETLAIRNLVPNPDL